MEKVAHQHGDLIFKVVKEIPVGAKKIPITENVYTLLKGEGVNTHDLKNERLSEVCEIYEKEGVLYLAVSECVEFNHVEHGVQVLEPSKIYKRVIEREWDAETEEARRTID